MNDKARTILILEDDCDLSFILEYILEKNFEHKIICTTTREGFLKTVATERIDLVIADLHCHSFLILDFMAEMNSSGRKIPVIILTASIDSEYNSKVFDAGAFAYYTKPFKPDKIITAVKKALEAV